MLHMKGLKTQCTLLRDSLLQDIDTTGAMLQDSSITFKTITTLNNTWIPTKHHIITGERLVIFTHINKFHINLLLKNRVLKVKNSKMLLIILKILITVTEF